MFDKIYTAYGTVEKFSASRSPGPGQQTVATVEDIIKKPTTLHGAELTNTISTGLQLDKTFTDSCNIEACYIEKDKCTKESGGGGFGATENIKSTNATCTLNCTTRKVNNQDIGCCFTNKKTGQRKCYPAGSIGLNFSSTKDPKIFYDRTKPQGQKLSATTSSASTVAELFTTEEVVVDESMPFFDQRVFRPSWALLTSTPTQRT